MGKTTTGRWLFCAALCALGMFACGGATDAVGEAGPTPTSPPVGTGNPGTPGPGVDVPPTPTREGGVYVSTIEEGESGAGVAAGASFGAKRSETVTPLAPGGCVIYDTFPPLDAPEEVPEPEPASDNAGTITVDVLLGKEQNHLKLPFDGATKQYEYFGGTADGPATGLIRVHANGGDVPSFDTEIPSLAPVRVTSPATDAPIAAGDLSIAWTYDGEDVPAVVYLESTKSVRCFASTARELVVPGQLVSEVLATKSSFLVVRVITFRTVKKVIGDYELSVSHNAGHQVDVTAAK